jgi:hypothetical protein
LVHDGGFALATINFTIVVAAVMVAAGDDLILVVLGMFLASAGRFDRPGRLGSQSSSRPAEAGRGGRNGFLQSLVPARSRYRAGSRATSDDLMTGGLR